MKLTNALSLKDAPGVRRLTIAEVPGLPLAKLPLSEVVAEARRHCQTQWFGVYLKGRKLGYITMGCRIGRHARRPALLAHSVFVLEVKTYGRVDRLRVETRTANAITGRGELLYLFEKRISNRERHLLTITRKPDGWHVDRRYHGGGIRKPPLRKVLRQLRADLTNGESMFMTLLARGRLKPGARYRLLSLDTDKLVVKASAYQLLASGVRSLRGVKVKLHKLEYLSPSDKIRSEAIHDAQGTLLMGRLMNVFVIKREEKSTARRFEKRPVDFGVGLVIPAYHAKLRLPARVSQLRLRVRGFLPAASKTYRRHRVKVGAGGAAELTISRESLKGLPKLTLPIKTPALAPHLKATHSIESDHPTIKALASKALGSERDALTATRLLNRFVYRYLRKSLTTNLDSALAIARVRAGDCTEHARLLTALARAVGLPAREVGGVTYVPGLAGFGYHAWVEVWVGRWISVDPSWDELPANATHIWLGGESDGGWIRTMGALRFEVLEVKH